MFRVLCESIRFWPPHGLLLLLLLVLRYVARRNRKNLRTSTTFSLRRFFCVRGRLRSVCSLRFMSRCWVGKECL